MSFFGRVEICKRHVLEVLMRFDKNPFRSYVSPQLIITEPRLGGGPGICGKTRLMHSDLDIMLRCKTRGGSGPFKRFWCGLAVLTHLIHGDDNDRGSGRMKVHAH